MDLYCKKQGFSTDPTTCFHHNATVNRGAWPSLHVILQTLVSKTHHQKWPNIYYNLFTKIFPRDLWINLYIARQSLWLINLSVHHKKITMFNEFKRTKKPLVTRPIYHREIFVSILLARDHEVSALSL